MKYKKRMAISLLTIILLLSIAGVSAGDVEDMVVQAGNDTLDDVVASDEDNSLDLVGSSGENNISIQSDDNLGVVALDEADGQDIEASSYGAFDFPLSQESIQGLEDFHNQINGLSEEKVEVPIDTSSADSALNGLQQTVDTFRWDALMLEPNSFVTINNDLDNVRNSLIGLSGSQESINAVTNATFRVNKALNNVVVSVADVTYGEKAVVEISADVDGEYKLDVNGTVYYITVNNGLGNKSFYLSAGLYYANVTFAEGNYVTKAKNATFRVNKALNNVIVSVSDVTYGKVSIIDIFAEADGKYELDVNGTVYTVFVNGHNGHKDIALDAGSYYANVTFDNGNYVTNVENATFKVNKADIDLIVVVFDEVYPQDVEGTVYASRDGSYNLTVSEYSTVVTVKGNIGYFNAGTLDAGTYTARVSFAGDDNYNHARNETKFVVNTIGTLFEIDITPDEIPYGEMIDVFNILSDGATGNITYYLSNGTFLAELPVDKVLRLPVLDAGHYVVVADYSGDKNFEPATDIAFLVVNPALNNVMVSVSDVTYGNESVIKVSSDVDGVYHVDVNGTVYNVDVSNGVGNRSVALDAGSYYANVTFDNGNYVTNAKNATFRVNKALNNVVVSVDDVTYGAESVVVVSGDVDGIYHVDINGTHLLFNVRNGFDAKSMFDLDAGSYYANVTFDNGNYVTNAQNATFRVNKALNNVVVSVDDVTYGNESVIEVSGDVDGIYHVDVNGTVYNVTVSNGVGNRSVALNAGSYYANATFANDNYSTNAKNTTFCVYKADVGLSVEAYDVTYPQNVAGTVYADIDGEYNLTIGEYSTTVTVKNGCGDFDAGILDAGNYTVSVSYPGDLNHNSNSSSLNITVSKYTPNIDLKVSDINYGEVGVITITSDVPGSVNVTLNNVTETLDLNGQSKDVLFASFSGILRAAYGATLNAHNLDAGSYPVTVVYGGDGNIEGVTLTGELNVNALNVTMDIDSTDVSVGEDEKITVTLPSGATGNVTVTVDGEKYTAPVENGKAVITIPGLTAGSKNAEVSYSGDGNYNPASGNVSFEVKKLKPEMSADTNSPVSGEKAHIVVKLPDDATGTVTITVDGKTYTAPVEDGKAVFDIPGLASGKYDVIAYYSGDDKYDAAQIELMLTVKDNSTKHEIHSDKSSLSGEMVAAGNPILVLLLALMTIGFTGIRRFKK